MRGEKLKNFSECQIIINLSGSGSLVTGRDSACSGACSGSIAAEKRATEGFVTRQLREIAQRRFCFGVKSGAAFSEENREPISVVGLKPSE